MLGPTWKGFIRRAADRLGATKVLGVGNESYVLSAPSPGNAVKLFAGMWSSKLPPPLAELPAGHAELFADPRLLWGLEQLDPPTGGSCLELGPLEGGHTYLMLGNGLGSVTAIEANGQAFLRCLVVKELLGLDRARFLCGDFVEYLKGPHPTFDLVVASGVLYHMLNPVELIELLSTTAPRIYLWTHYFDPEIIQANARLSAKFRSQQTVSHAGFTHTLHQQLYGPALNWSGFCGGTAPSSNWMTRSDLLACLAHFGYQVLGIAHEEPLHPNGPCLALAALRTKV